MGIAIAVLLLILALDLWVIRRVWAEPYSTRQQKWLQTALVLLVPLFGAYGLHIFLRRGPDFDPGDFPKNPGMEGRVYGSGIDTRMGGGPH